jgi:broad specificity phosphatase PhoE
MVRRREAHQSYRHRIDGAGREPVARPGRASLTHGHFGRVLGARWIGLSVAYARRLLLDTASISVLEYEDDLRGQPVIAKWNG